MVDGMSYLEVTLEGKIQVQQVLPLLEDPVEVGPLLALHATTTTTTVRGGGPDIFGTCPGVRG